jgi:hypothetical protein
MSRPIAPIHFHVLAIRKQIQNPVAIFSCSRSRLPFLRDIAVRQAPLWSRPKARQRICNVARAIQSASEKKEINAALHKLVAAPYKTRKMG